MYSVVTGPDFIGGVYEVLLKYQGSIECNSKIFESAIVMEEVVVEVDLEFPIGEFIVEVAATRLCFVHA